MGSSGATIIIPTPPPVVIPPITIRQQIPKTVTLALNVPQDVSFTWSGPFADASYLYDVAVSDGLLGKITVVQKTKTPAGLTLTVTATALVAVGQAISVEAWMQ